MDLKIMLDPENISNKAVLKEQNYETRLPLITKKKSAPVSNLYSLMGLLYALLFTLKVN